MASRLIPLLMAATIGCAGCGAAGSHTSVARQAGAAASRHPFVASVHKRRAVLWAVGDSAGGANAGRVASLIKRGKPDRFLYLGDVYPDGTAFASYTRAYGSLESITAPSPGNHDWGPGYRRHWGNPPEWYSFTAAGWRIISLNSETSRGGAQLAYLKSRVRAPGSCRIAFWHRPRYSGGLHGDNADMDPYWRALAGHATLVLNGHDHDMQRFAPRNGLTELIAGAGGESHYPVHPHAGLRFHDATHWGALRLDLRPHVAQIAFVSTAGSVLDSQTVRCA